MPPVSQLVKWRSPECCWCASSVSSLKTPVSGRSSLWFISIPTTIATWRHKNTPSSSENRWLKRIRQEDSQLTVHPTVCGMAKACGGLQGLLEEGSLIIFDHKNVSFCPSDKTLCLANAKHCTSPQIHQLHREAWWWQHHALGMLLSSRPWKT